MKAKITGKQCKAFRVKSKINQVDFWSVVGVTQSGGSRYESGRAVPKPVQLLLVLIWRLGNPDQAVLTQLRQHADKLVKRDG
jgi:DNA-binding transcriptional regulator YiaG